MGSCVSAIPPNTNPPLHNDNGRRHSHESPARQINRNDGRRRSPNPGGKRARSVSPRHQQNDARRQSPNGNRNQNRPVSPRQQQDDQRSSHSKSPAQLRRFNHEQSIANSSANLLRRRHENSNNQTIEEEMYEAFVRGDNNVNAVLKGIPLDTIVKNHEKPPAMKPMYQMQDANTIFLIEPFAFDITQLESEPRPIDQKNGYIDQWDDDHVHMPCSSQNITRDRKPVWPSIVERLLYLKQKCDGRSATFNDLRKTIIGLTGREHDLSSLEKLIENIYSNEEAAHFMSTVLSKICELVFTMQTICTRPPPLLRQKSNKSVTMSQSQAASLLACAFFCLFPDRSGKEQHRQFERYPNPNFNRLYEHGSPEKIEKLKCILHYFRRVAKKMPNGVITFQRFALPRREFPQWNDSKANLCELSLLTSKKIEDIPNALQVDFANKYIGGGVLGNGCVQEEIRFAICPEMLVSLLVCEVMDDNECVFLIGCERYSKYKGYAQSFQFDGDYKDSSHKDSWGRRWCHLVAIDAIFFRDRTEQYHMKKVERELLKAYVGFRPMENGAEHHYGIATGNWGCGAFNGDRELKAIIQLIAASEAKRPLIYAAFADRNLVDSFSEVYNYLKDRNVKVGDLYWYLLRYSDQHTKCSLFKFILKTTVSSY